MRAMMLEGIAGIDRSSLKMRQVDIPKPGSGQILVRVECCGVCHTDLHTVEGEVAVSALPRVLGHQIVGTVETPGPGSSRFDRGARVGVPWLYSTCGACGFCRSGRENLCPNARFTGVDVDGGYAEFVVAEEGFVCALPDEVSATEAAPLLCAGVIGYRALRMSAIRPGGRLGLYGFGASAHIAIQVARHWGCRVFVFSRSRGHRAMAIELGAEWTGLAEDTPPDALDSAVVFAPAGQIVPQVLRVLDRGGTVALAGIYMSPIPEMEYSRIYGERTIRSVANATRDDAARLLRLAGEIPIKTRVEVYRLEEANRALLALKRSEIDGAAVLEVSREGN